MNPSYLYHAFGVRHQECTKTEYKGNQNIHYIQTRKDELCCPECKSCKIIRSGSIYRDIRSVPVGHRETILRMKVQRVECKSCGCIRQEKIHFVTGKRSYTNKFARYVVDLSRIGTIKDVALFLNIDTWGRGFIKIREGFEGAGMPMPKVENFCGGVQVTIERTKFVQMTNVGDNVGDNVGGQKVAKLAERQRKMLDLIKENPRMSANEMSEVLSVTQRTIERDLAAMQKQGIIIREGNVKSGRWVILQK